MTSTSQTVAGALPVALIVAVAENGVMGAEGALPWHISSDLKRFRKLTMGKPMIMGRKTHQSIGKALDGRDNIVLTRRGMKAPNGVILAHSWAEACATAENCAQARNAAEIMVIGGAEIYRLAIPQAQRVYYTQVFADVGGDTFFPALTPDAWQVTQREEKRRDDKDSAFSQFSILERISNA